MFNMMMRSVFKPLQEKWNNEKVAVKMRINTGQKRRVWGQPERCYLLAASREEIRMMIEDTTEELRKRGLDWKEDQMELMTWGFEEEVGDVLFDYGGRRYKVKEVKALAGHGSDDHTRSGLDECHEISDEKGGQGFVDGFEILQKQELPKGGSTKCIERWYRHAFFTRASAGAGTRRWWTRCVAGKAEIWIYHEYKEVGQKRLELGMVSSESNQDGEKKVC